MRKAIEAVRENRMGWMSAAKTHGIPRATLRRHVLKENKTLLPGAKGMGTFKNTFPPEVERQLVSHIKVLEKERSGLTGTAVQEIAFNFAEKNGLNHNFNRKKKRAGRYWLHCFLRRLKDISVIAYSVHARDAALLKQ